MDYTNIDSSFVPYCATLDGQSSLQNPPPTPLLLNEQLRDAAIQYGLAILEQNARDAPAQRVRGMDQRITYIADMFVSVFVEDAGVIHGITVKPEMAQMIAPIQ